MSREAEAAIRKKSAGTTQIYLPLHPHNLIVIKQFQNVYNEFSLHPWLIPNP